MLATGTVPDDQPRIGDSAVRLDGPTAILTVRTGGNTNRGSPRTFQLVVPTATPGLRRVVFGPARTVLRERRGDADPCGD